MQFGKARTAGTAPGTIVSAALRQVAQLHRARLAVEDGASVSEAVGAIQPFVHFSRKAAVEAALKTWTAARLERAMAQLADAALEARKQAGHGGRHRATHAAGAGGERAAEGVRRHRGCCRRNRCGRIMEQS